MDGLVMEDIDRIMEEAVDEEEQKQKDEEVLGYNNVVLRKSDLDLLRGPHYLNDCIIEFYFCYINSLTNSGDILLVSPTLSFWLANCQDSESFKDFEESHQVSQKQVVIFTVNDNRNVSEIDGGSHWSLLVYYRKPNTFVHYDSLGSLNRCVAWKLYGAVKKHVAAAASDTSTRHLIVDCVLLDTFNFRGKQHGHHDKLMMMLQQRHHRYHRHSYYNIYEHEHEYPCYREESRMPRQKNLYDCGLYVMAISKLICEWYSDHSTTAAAHCFPNITNHLDISLESTMRPQLLTLIQQLYSSSTASHSPQPQAQAQAQAHDHLLMNVLENI